MNDIEARLKKLEGQNRILTLAACVAGAALFALVLFVGMTPRTLKVEHSFKQGAFDAFKVEHSGTLKHSTSMFSTALELKHSGAIERR